MGISGEEYLSQGSKKKGPGKNKSRKLGRNFKYYGTTHSQTLYRSRGHREKNKARRAAQRERRLSLAAERRRGRYVSIELHQDHNGSEEGHR